MLVFVTKAGLGRCVSITLAKLWEKLALEMGIALLRVILRRHAPVKMASQVMTVRIAVMIRVLEGMEVVPPILRVLCVTVAMRAAGATTSVRAKSIRMMDSALTNKRKRKHARVETRMTAR